MLGLKPVKLMPARERVASALRKAIISRQIKEGETLALEATAQELVVSITPVREAFQILARDGLLELKQNKGATVLGVTEKTLRDHYQIRAVLEGYACVLCVETGADLSALQNCLKVSEEMIASGDSSRYIILYVFRSVGGQSQRVWRDHTGIYWKDIYCDRCFRRFDKDRAG